MSSNPSYSPVCMIYSELTLTEIENIFDAHGGGYKFMRVLRTKDTNGNWHDTNRTIAVITEQLFNSLMSVGFNLSAKSRERPPVDFRIVPFEIRQGNLPQEGYKKDLFVRLPQSEEINVGRLREIIIEKLLPLVETGVIGKDDYEIKIPLRNKNRVNGEVSRACFITFSPQVTVEQAALVRTVIDDTFWGTSKEPFRCNWARAREKEEPAPRKILQRLKEGTPLDKDGNKAFYKSEIVTFAEGKA